MQISKTQLNKFKNHVLKQYPNEACAIVIEGDNGKLNVINCENSHEDPLNNFRINASVISEYVINKKLRAVLHSHIAKSIHQAIDYRQQGDIRTPSANDIQGHNDTNVPWGIVATDGETVSEPLWLDDNEIAPLEGRSFVHGLYDCWSIVRDYLRLHKGITLKNYPRDPSWWNSGQSLCNLSAISDAGLVSIAYKELIEGDIVLMKIGSPVPNHWAVVTGNNTILHQLPHRLSTTDSLSKWSKYIVGCYRYNDFF